MNSQNTKKLRNNATRLSRGTLLAVISIALALPLRADQPTQSTKKRVAIISMRRGGLHTNAAQVIKNELSATYDVTIVNVFDEILSSLDTVHTISRGKYTGDDFYVSTCRVAGEWAIAPLQSLGKYLLKNQSERIAKLVEDFLRRGEYQMVISVIPYINYAIYRAARAVSIPAMVVMLDLDSDHWINDMQQAYYTKFTYAMVGENISMRVKLHAKQIPDSCIHVVGFPVKPIFSEPAQISELKKEFEIPENKPVVMVMMGAEGTPGIWLYARALAQSNTPLHACICLGRDERVRSKIKQLSLKNGVSFSIVSFTDRIADYMAVSDVLITKPGLTSIIEAVSRKLPMIIDNTSQARTWEAPHINFVIQNNFGAELRAIAQLPALLNCFLQDKAIIQVIKNAMENYIRTNGATTLKNHVDSMLMFKK